MTTRAGKAEPIECKFAPIPDLFNRMTPDFRKHLVELLKQDNWAINRIIEVLMEKKMENSDRIARIEEAIKVSDSLKDGEG